MLRRGKGEILPARCRMIFLPKYFDDSRNLEIWT
jgi:hypothetical protein